MPCARGSGTKSLPFWSLRFQEENTKWPNTLAPLCVCLRAFLSHLWSNCVLVTGEGQRLCPSTSVLGTGARCDRGWWVLRSPLPNSRWSYLIEVHPQAFFSWMGKVDLQKWKWCWVRYGQESGFQTTWGHCSDENICILGLFITS